jgi:hypothetical protein
VAELTPTPVGGGAPLTLQRSSPAQLAGRRQPHIAELTRTADDDPLRRSSPQPSRAAVAPYGGAHPAQLAVAPHVAKLIDGANLDSTALDFDLTTPDLGSRALGLVSAVQTSIQL